MNRFLVAASVSSLVAAALGCEERPLGGSVNGGAGGAAGAGGAF